MELINKFELDDEYDFLAEYESDSIARKQCDIENEADIDVNVDDVAKFFYAAEDKLSQVSAMTESELKDFQTLVITYLSVCEILNIFSEQDKMYVDKTWVLHSKLEALSKEPFEGVDSVAYLESEQYPVSNVFVDEFMTHKEEFGGSFAAILMFHELANDLLHNVDGIKRVLSVKALRHNRKGWEAFIKLGWLIYSICVNSDVLCQLVDKYLQDWGNSIGIELSLLMPERGVNSAINTISRMMLHSCFGTQYTLVGLLTAIDKFWRMSVAAEKNFLVNEQLIFNTNKTPLTKEELNHFPTDLRVDFYRRFCSTDVVRSLPYQTMRLIAKKKNMQLSLQHLRGVSRLAQVAHEHEFEGDYKNVREVMQFLDETQVMPYCTSACEFLGLPFSLYSDEQYQDRVRELKMFNAQDE